MKVNGVEVKIEEGKILQEYLEENNYHTGRVAVECNGEIVPKSMYKEHALSDSDTLEIVHFVGGG